MDDNECVEDFCSKLNNVLNGRLGDVGEIPSVLYQYTDITALQGIAENNVLWATHFRYLNDKKELDFGINLSVQYIEEHRSEFHELCTNVFFDEIIDMCQKSHLNNMLPFHLTDIYSISLTSKGDLLSQWRGYGKKYRSVCIGFDRNQLACDVIDGKHTFFLRKIIYEPEQQKDIIDSYMREASFILEENADFFERDKEALLEVKRHIYTGLIVAALCFKEKCWKEEDEWRIITLPFDSVSGDDLRVFFKENNYGLVPYIKIPIFINNCAIMAMKKVILPKSENFIRFKKSLEMFLNQKGYEYLPPIVESDISIVY